MDYAITARLMAMAWLEDICQAWLRDEIDILPGSLYPIMRLRGIIE
jgi:hypothetical protein